MNQFYQWFRLWMVVGLVGAVILSSASAQEKVVIPDSPTGKQLSGFLTALNSGQRPVIKEFFTKNLVAPPGNPAFYDNMADDHVALFKSTSGFELRKITKAGPAAITALVQAKSTGIWSELEIYLKAAPPDFVLPVEPYQIVGLGQHTTVAPVEFLGSRKLTDVEISARTDTLMKALVASDSFSGTVQVWKENVPIYAKGFGLAHKSPDIPINIDSEFNLASITKMFTAVAVAQLVESGKLSYTDTVGKILPDYPNKEVAQTVTISQLLAHTSGIIGGRELAMKFSNPSNALTIDDRLKDFENEPLKSPPGQQYGYSNAGYILLGKIIEKVSGQSYYDYIQDHIFKPADMEHTGFPLKTQLPKNAATGYMDGPNGQRIDNAGALDLKGAPNEGAYSTGGDMARFHAALTSGKLVNPQSLRQLWTGVTDNGKEEYGYGARIVEYNGVRIVGHGGGWQGITNEFDMYPDLGVTVVVLSNYDDDPTGVADKLREWLTQGIIPAKKMDDETPPAIKESAEVSSSKPHVGDAVTVRISVSDSGGDLRAGIVNLDIKSSDGTKAAQRLTMDQRIRQGQERSFVYSWTPGKPGDYTFDVGIFGKGWNPTYRFDSAAVKLTVR
jgi:CubicO group peptidase (beta-lactamase class C family)